MWCKSAFRNSYRCTYPMWWMYSRALSMPSKMYAMVSSLIPSVKCVQIRSLADPERPANMHNHERAVLYGLIGNILYFSY